MVGSLQEIYDGIGITSGQIGEGRRRQGPDHREGDRNWGREVSVGLLFLRVSDSCGHSMLPPIPTVFRSLDGGTAGLAGCGVTSVVAVAGA